MININKKTKLLLLPIICCFFIFFIFKKFKPGKEPRKKEAVRNDLVTAANSEFDSTIDLYYLKHPYLTKGDQLNDEKKYDSAIYYYNEASVKFEREGLWANYVWVNGYIARLYLYVAGKDYREALSYLKKSEEKGKQYLSVMHPYVAATCYYWGLYYYNEKLVGKSLTMLNKALKIYQQNYSTDNLYIADVFNALGDIYTNLMFDIISGRDHYLRSIKIIEILPGNKNKVALTRNYYKLVQLNLEIGDYERAQSFCYEAIRNVQYTANYGNYWIELLEGMLANIYKDQKIYDKAIDKLKSVIDINNKNKGDGSFLSFYFNSLGSIYAEQAKYDSAITFYKKALSLTRINTLLSNQEEQAAVSNYSLGMIFFELKNYKTAGRYLNKCLNQSVKIYGNKHSETAKVLTGIGLIYQGEGISDSALKYFQAGLIACTKNFNDTSIYNNPFVSDVNNSYYLFQVIKEKASALKQLYDKTPSDRRLLFSSLACYCLADTLMTLFKSGYDRETAKLVFSKENNDIYEAAIDCAALLYGITKQSSYHDLVFNLMDKRKSSLLLQGINENELLELAEIPGNEQNKLKSLQQELTFLQSQLENENSRQNPEESVLQALHGRIDIREAKFNALHERLVNEYPYYASLQQRADTLSLKDMLLYSKHTNSMILEYFWGSKAIYVLGICKGTTQLLKIQKNNELDKMLETFQANINRGYVVATKEVDFNAFRESSFYIFKSLLNPVLASFESQLKQGSDKPGLIIIPDGPLSYMPAEALVTASGAAKEVDYQKLDYLVNNYVISYGYSARLLLKNYQFPNTVQVPRLLGLAFSQDQPSQLSQDKFDISNRYHTLELPGTTKEIKSIASYMKGRFYLGDDATESVFKKEAPGYDIIHLAVHGESDSMNRYNSKLVFKKGADTMNDGNLYAYEIYNLPIKAKLAVLSACESGVGKMNSGEGIFSIARGFVYAGCPSVIISYWRVNDDATQRIISSFYKQISAGDKIDQSLAKAKLDYLNKSDQRTAHPANWSALVAIGNMTPLLKKISPVTPVLLITLLILLLTDMVLTSRNSQSVKEID